MKHLIVLKMWEEYEGFEKPGGMAKVPFGWTYINNGLYNVVLLL